MSGLRFCFRMLSGALCAPIVVGCSSPAATFAPSAIYGSIESARMSPKTHDALIAGLRHKIKHVFVIFQENHSFDNYFGTYPGAENLGTAFAKAHGYSQNDPIGGRQQTVF